MPKAVVNETAKTVSIQTTHFSDWEFFKGVRLKVQRDLLYLLETTDLKVYGNINIFNNPLEKEHPLSASLIEPKYIKSWKLKTDYGSLTTKGAEGTLPHRNIWQARRTILIPS